MTQTVIELSLGWFVKVVVYVESVMKTCEYCKYCYLETENLSVICCIDPTPVSRPIYLYACRLFRAVRRQEEDIEDNFDFESLYAEFPRKEGKAAGMKKCISRIKSKKAFDRLQLAIKNYNLYIYEKDIAPQYVKKFGNWMEDWEEWAERGEEKARLDQQLMNLLDGEEVE